MHKCGAACVLRCTIKAFSFPSHVCVIWAWLAPNRLLSRSVWEAGGTRRGSAVEHGGSCSPGASVGAAHYIPNPESHHIWEDNHPELSCALFCLLFLYSKCHFFQFSFFLYFCLLQAVWCHGDTTPYGHQAVVVHSFWLLLPAAGQQRRCLKDSDVFV